MVYISVNHRGGLTFTGCVTLSQFSRRDDGEMGSGCECCVSADLLSALTGSSAMTTGVAL